MRTKLLRESMDADEMDGAVNAAVIAATNSMPTDADAGTVTLK
jgi:hypothetical protein